MNVVQTQDLYVGVDVGGTKIMAALVASNGRVVARIRRPTPRNTKGAQVIRVIGNTVEKLLKDAGAQRVNVRGVGLAIPGTLAPDEGRVVLTPNMTLSGLRVAPILQKRLKLPVVMGNDVNLGTLGEAWLGAARAASSVVGIFVGTGIGAGVIMDRKLVTGCRNSAGEIGHIMLQKGGRRCGCGNRGCLETFASRSAIERDIRAAIKSGRKSSVRALAGGDLSIIKSSVLKRALKQGDDVATAVVRRAAETLGYACLTVRHLLDPDLIVLGGGLIEACGRFILPVVERIVRRHSLPGSQEREVIVASSLGDDAVVLGAVALARSQVEHTRELPRGSVVQPAPSAHIRCNARGLTVDGTSPSGDVLVRADGHIKTDVAAVHVMPDGAAVLRSKFVAKFCREKPELLIVGTRAPKRFSLSPKALAWLRDNGIQCRICRTADAVALHYRTGAPHVLFIHQPRRRT
jgi:glucokinase